jgi:hypothetical protein
MPGNEESRHALQELADMVHGRYNPPPRRKVPFFRALKMAWMWQRRTGGLDCFWWALVSRSSDMESWYDVSDLAVEARPPWRIMETLALCYCGCMLFGPFLVADALHWKGWRLLWLVPLWFVSMTSAGRVFECAENFENWQKRSGGRESGPTA